MSGLTVPQPKGIIVPIQILDQGTFYTNQWEEVIPVYTGNEAGTRLTFV